MKTKLNNNQNTITIEVSDEKPQKKYGILSGIGRITIGDFTEQFSMPLDSWTLDEYKKQWDAGIARIKTGEISCLVTAVQTIATNPLVILWPLYPVGSTIFVHNQLLIPPTVEHIAIPLKKFTAENCYQFINPRLVNDAQEAVGDEGELVSEWSIDLNEVG